MRGLNLISISCRVQCHWFTLSNSQIHHQQKNFTYLLSGVEYQAQGNFKRKLESRQQTRDVVYQTLKHTPGKPPNMINLNNKGKQQTSALMPETYRLMRVCSITVNTVTITHPVKKNTFFLILYPKYPIKISKIESKISWMSPHLML